METPHVSDPRTKVKRTARLIRLRTERFAWQARRRLRGQAIWALVAATGVVGIVLTVYLMISGISVVGTAEEKRTSPETAKSTRANSDRTPVELPASNPEEDVPENREKVQLIESMIIERPEADPSHIQTTGGQFQPIETSDGPEPAFLERPAGSFDDNPFSKFANPANTTAAAVESSPSLEIELVRIAPSAGDGNWTSADTDDPQFQVIGTEITRDAPAELDPFAEAALAVERTDSPGWTAFNDLRIFSPAPPAPKFELVEFSAEAAATTTVHELQIKFEVDVPDDARLGRPFVVQYRITNTGQVAVTAVSIYSDLPAELEHRFGRKLEKTIGRLAPGESCFARLNARAVKAGTARISTRLVVDGLSLETAIRDSRVRAAVRP